MARHSDPVSHTAWPLITEIRIIAEIPAVYRGDYFRHNGSFRDQRPEGRDSGVLLAAAILSMPS